MCIRDRYQDYKNINVFTTGLGKKKHPRRSYYTTQGDVREGPLDDLLETAEGILFGGEPDNGQMCIRDRFMSINREYSIDGYSEQLRPEYAELGRSQLEEMLKLPDTDRQMIQPETSREDIRELKRFNKTEPAAGVADDISQLVEKFYQDNELILNAVYGEEFDEQTINRFIEIVNPAGNRSYKKGLYFMMMYENRVTFRCV